jgi:membrane dipeptidase
LFRGVGVLHDPTFDMQRIEFEDYRNDPGRWASQLGVSREAVELYLASEVIDLHLDSFIWTRVLGYDLRARHGTGLLGGRIYSQVDLPRVLDACMAGAMWSITTNPWRSAAGRARTFARNLQQLHALFASVGDQVRVVRSASEYAAARAAGLHAAFLAVQGGNAFDADLGLLSDGSIVRVTLVHLTNSAFGATSSPLRLGSGGGLSARGRAFVEALNARRVFVDLAHIGRQGFFDVAAVHDRSQPLIVTHTGVSGAYPSWRNIDDEQLALVADTGGVVGVVFHGQYLSGHYFTGGPMSAVLDHLAHIVKVAGEDVAALGSDWDGAIIPPKELRSCVNLPRLVQGLLDRRWKPTTIQKVLGGNFLRALRQLRP